MPEPLTSRAGEAVCTQGSGLKDPRLNPGAWDQKREVVAEVARMAGKRDPLRRIALEFLYC